MIMPKQYIDMAYDKNLKFFDLSKKIVDLNGATVPHKAIVTRKFRDFEKFEDFEEKYLKEHPLTES